MGLYIELTSTITKLMESKGKRCYKHISACVHNYYPQNRFKPYIVNLVDFKNVFVRNTKFCFVCSINNFNFTFIYKIYINIKSFYPLSFKLKFWMQPWFPKHSQIHYSLKIYPPPFLKCSRNQTYLPELSCGLNFHWSEASSLLFSISICKCIKKNELHRGLLTFFD